MDTLPRLQTQGQCSGIRPVQGRYRCVASPASSWEGLIPFHSSSHSHGEWWFVRGRSMELGQDG